MKAFIQEFLVIEKERNGTDKLIYDYIDGDKEWLELKGEILTFNQPEKQKKRKNNNWKRGPKVVVNRRNNRVTRKCNRYKTLQSALESDRNVTIGEVLDDKFRYEDEPTEHPDLKDIE